MDLQKLESLYDEFASAAYAFALQLTRDPDAAQDLVQSVFLRLARRPRFTILNPRSFVLRCVYRAHVDAVRRDSTRRQMLESFALEPRPCFRAEPEDDEKIAELLEKLAALPEEQRVVVHLKTWEGRTFRQIAGILGIPANTAASRYRYALDKLRDAMRLEDET
jgi:RNA polymerase sigma-70 factor (ECF subfamily)